MTPAIGAGDRPRTFNMTFAMLLWLLLIISFPAALIINWLMTDKSDMGHGRAAADWRAQKEVHAQETAVKPVAGTR